MADTQLREISSRERIDAMRRHFGMGIALVLAACTLVALVPAAETAAQPTAESRRPADDAELRYWLLNMVSYHSFTDDEVAAATGLSPDEVAATKKRFDISADNRPHRQAGDVLTVLPYPGGRHPRIGFLDGAVRPQRETKISVFAPWDERSYVVADVPEAIWSNLGLLYLAHTHVPTVWTRQNIELERLEWNRRSDGTLDIERRLPGGVRFGVKARPTPTAVRIEMWLTNGSNQPLSDLRVQNCVMLKGAEGFKQQTNDNKVFRAPYAACRAEDGRHWVITAWQPCHRAWGNAPCPCLHSDPKFPDCAPGETQRLVGWLSFFEGTDIQAELDRIEASAWHKGT